MGIYAKTERNAEIVSSVLNGETEASIANRMGISKQRVSQIYMRETKGTIARAEKENRRREAVSAYISGEPIKDIAERIHVSANTIFKYVSKEHRIQRHESLKRNRQEVVNDIMNGMKPKAARAKHGVSYSYIRQSVGNEYYEEQKKNRDARNRAIIEMHNSGMRNCDIAKELNVMPFIVYNTIKKLA